MKKSIVSLKRAVVTGVCLCLLPMVSHAEGGQTAEGAQAFLAAMTKRGFARASFVDASGRANVVSGTHQLQISRIKTSIKEENSHDVVETSLGELIVSGLSSGDAQGNTDACMTRIDGIQPPANLFVSNNSSWEEPSFLISVTVIKSETWDYTAGFQKFAAPHFIDWRQAQVIRSNDGSRIDVKAKGQAFPTHFLSFVPGDSELADRIEDAAKFLRLSCDEAAETGF